MLTIELNGKPYTLAARASLHDLIAELGLADKALAAAVNRQLVARHQWAERLLQADDCVDVVRAIGGG